MEIFISGSQVCAKKNTFGLGPFQVCVCMSRVLLERKVWPGPGKEKDSLAIGRSGSQPRVRWLPLTTLVPTVDVFCVQV